MTLFHQNPLSSIVHIKTLPLLTYPQASSLHHQMLLSIGLHIIHQRELSSCRECLSFIKAEWISRAYLLFKGEYALFLLISLNVLSRLNRLP
jgi:hypothetical protein